MEGFWLYFFQLWLKAVALMGPGVENCSTIRGHFNFITCLVDLTKILNHTRRHFPNLEQPPFDRAADIRDTSAVCSWFSMLCRTVESTIIKATACTSKVCLMRCFYGCLLKKGKWPRERNVVYHTIMFSSGNTTHFILNCADFFFEFSH